MIIAAKGAAASAPGALTYLWVGVGSSGNLYTSDSTTAASWTSRTSSFGADGIYGVASNNKDLYVAVGAAGKLATSPDGITWTQRTSSFSTSIIWGVAYGANTWVAVGESGKLATSSDGITWTQRTSGVATEIYSVAYGNGLWCYGTTGGGLRTATDPTSTWTSRTSTLASAVNSLYYDPSDALWHAGNDAGTTGALATSPDGTTWTARTSTYSQSGPSMIPTNRQAFASNTTVIVNGGNIDLTTWDVQSSTTGTTWTNRTPADTTEQMCCAASDATGFLVFGGSKIQTSSDGTTWTDRGVPAAGVSFNFLCHSSGVPAIR